MGSAAKITRRTGEVEYYSGKKRVSKESYEKEAASESKQRAARVSSSRPSTSPTEAQKITETTPLSEFGKAEGTAKVTRKEGGVEYYAGGQKVYTSSKPSKYYSTVTTKSGDSIYRYSASLAGGGVSVKEVYAEPVAVYQEGKITGYQTGQRFSIRPSPQQVATTQPQQVTTPRQPSMISAAPEKSIWGKIKGSAVGGVWKEFKAGFGFRESPSLAFGGKEAFESTITGRSKSGEIFGATEAGFRRVGYTLGATAGIAASSAYLWEGVGAKAAAAAYKSPKVWSAVEKTGKVLGSPAGKYVQRSSLIIYGGFKSADVAAAARTEGSTGVAREGLKISRTVAGIGGFGKGFKEGTTEQIGKTYYLVKGEARAATKVSGKTFESGLAARGKIYEFAGTKLRRTFTFQDVAKVSGKTKEVVRVISPYRTPLGKTEKITTSTAIKGYIKGRTDISLKGKGYAQYMTASDVKALQTSRSAVLTEFEVAGKKTRLGIGGSRFQFKEARNVFGDEFGLKILKQDKVIGIGKSSYKFADTGDIITVRGKVSTLDPRVTTQFGFKEQIARVGKTRGFVDLTDGAGLATQAASKQLTQSILGRISPAAPQQVVKAAAAIPKRTSKPFVEQPQPSPIDKIIQKPKEPSPIMKTKEVYADPIDKMLAVQPPREKTRSRQRARADVGLKQIVIVDSLTDQRSRVTPKPVVKPVAQIFLPKTKVDQRIAQRQDLALRQSQVFDAPVGFGKGVGFGLVATPPKTFFPAFPLPDFGGDQKVSKTKSKEVSFGTKYTPTLEAELFDITGRKPSKAAIQSGLTVRPILL